MVLPCPRSAKHAVHSWDLDMSSKALILPLLRQDAVTSVPVKTWVAGRASIMCGSITTMMDAISMKHRVLELLVPASIHILGFLVKWDMWYTNSTRMSVSFALQWLPPGSLDFPLAHCLHGISLECQFLRVCTVVAVLVHVPQTHLSRCTYGTGHPMQSIGNALIKSGTTLVAATHQRGTWAVLTWIMVLRVTLSAIQLHASVEDLLCCIVPDRPTACHAPFFLWMETDRCLWLNQLIPTVPTSDAVATHLCCHKSMVYQPEYAAGTWHIPIPGHWEYSQPFHSGCWSKPVLPHKWQENYRHYQKESSQYPEQGPPVVWGVQKKLFL